jgi:hypothetical protein
MAQVVVEPSKLQFSLAADNPNWTSQQFIPFLSKYYYFERLELIAPVVTQSDGIEIIDYFV